MVEKKCIRILGILLACIVLYGMNRGAARLTYLEYTVKNEAFGEELIDVGSGDSLVQAFYMPYDLLHGISVQIDAPNPGNGAAWSLSIVEKETGTVVCEHLFGSSTAADGNFLMFEFAGNIRMKKGSLYEMRISAEDADELRFYASPNPLLEENLYLNEKPVDGSLGFTIYGGDMDFWWAGLVLLLGLFGAVLLLRGNFLLERGRNLAEDRFFMSMLLAVVTFMLLFSFAEGETFIDENDNIRGGLLIADGGVLYRDYVTQHMPLTYYICSIFALLGAKSIGQFRLSYYLFEAIVWGLLYFRHAGYYGKKKMFLLPILENILIICILKSYGFQILSDRIQGICTVALMLEFFRYYKDRNLGWIRSAIISACVWGCFGTIFLSVYPLIWVVLIVIGTEAVSWTENGFTVKKALLRYEKLLISLAVPPICAVLYFWGNHCLGTAFRQFYTFNREVYPIYNAGFGGNILQPFFEAFRNLFSVVSSNIDVLFAGEGIATATIQLAVLGNAIAAIAILGLKRRYTEAFLLFMVMCCSAARGYAFHGFAAWHIAIMAAVMFGGEIAKSIPKAVYPVVGLFSILALTTYAVSLYDNFLWQQTGVTEIESEVVSMTEEGDGILIDGTVCDSIYLLYKNRNPVNRTVYMLPWYMDWYEQDTIDDLCGKKPKIAIYNEDILVWDRYQYYANDFLAELKASYTRLSDNPEDGWRYYVWVRDD